MGQTRAGNRTHYAGSRHNDGESAADSRIVRLIQTPVLPQVLSRTLQILPRMERTDLRGLHHILLALNPHGVAPVGAGHGIVIYLRLVDGDVHCHSRSPGFGQLDDLESQGQGILIGKCGKAQQCLLPLPACQGLLVQLFHFENHLSHCSVPSGQAAGCVAPGCLWKHRFQRSSSEAMKNFPISESNSTDTAGILAAYMSRSSFPDRK